MYNYTARCRRFSFGGNEMMRFQISLPIFEGCPNITSFYQTLAENCESWCESVLFSRILEEKTANNFNFRRRLYSFSVSVGYISEEYICMSLKTTLSVGREILNSYACEQIWEIATEQMIPQKYALREISAALGVSSAEVLERISQMEKTPLSIEKSNG